MNAIDTNVWLYSHDTRDPRKQALAQQLIATTRPLALPWQVGCEFVAASRKLAVVGFTESQAWTALAAMEVLADVVLLPVPDLWRETQALRGRRRAGHAAFANPATMARRPGNRRVLCEAAYFRLLLRQNRRGVLLKRR